MAQGNELGARLAALEADLADIRRRLARLEAQRQAPPADPPALASHDAGPVAAGPAARQETPADEAPAPLAGKVLLALAGAYLVRSLTDSGRISVAAGVSLALAYAIAFLPAAWRAAGLGRRLAATAHGVTAALIAYPLLWEATVRFHLLPPPSALALAAAFGAGALLLAAQRALPLVAWGHAGSVALTALSLLVATHHLAPAVLCLLSQAALLEALQDRRAVRGLRWLAAAALDLGVLALVFVAGRPEGFPAGYPPLEATYGAALALALPILYLASLAAGTLRSRRALVAPEILQLAIALGLGFEGARRVLRAHDGPALVVAGAAIAVGLLGYGVAFAFVERRQGHGVNFYAYSSGAALLLLLGAHQLESDPVRVGAWSALAVACALVAQRFDRATLRYHALAFLGAAGLVGGLAALIVSGVFAAAPEPAGLLPAPAWAAVVLAWAVLARGAPAASGAVPRGLAALLALFSLPAALTSAVPAGTDLDLGLRSALFAILAIALAALARPSRPELRWLSHAALVAGALKLLTVDLPSGRSAVLFGSFLLLGGALVASSRLLGTRR